MFTSWRCAPPDPRSSITQSTLTEWSSSGPLRSAPPTVAKRGDKGREGGRIRGCALPEALRAISPERIREPLRPVRQQSPHRRGYSGIANPRTHRHAEPSLGGRAHLLGKMPFRKLPQEILVLSPPHT